MKKAIPYSKLIVNPKNYRFDPVENQEEAIDLMLKKKGSEITNIAKHILEHGLDKAKDLRVLEIDSEKYRVLDGNRRITAIKCLHDQSLIKNEKLKKAFLNLLKIKKTIPTNIQSFVYDDEKSAAKWIKLDHTGKNKGVGQDSWGSAEKDRFAEKFEGKVTRAMRMVSLIEQELGEEINTEKLKVSTINRIVSNPESCSYLCVNFIQGKLIVTADKKEACTRIKKLFDKVIEDNVTVEKVYNRDKSIKFMKELFGDSPKDSTKNENTESNEKVKKRKTQRENNKRQEFFGKKLILKKGDTNNIYRDILDLYDFYTRQRDSLSDNFPAIIRMSLRLLVESAACYIKKGIQDYVQRNFIKAKKNLTKDQKTTLASNSIGDDKALIQLLQSGAHDYTNSANFGQTVAMSIIIGAMLEITHSTKPNA